MPQYSLALAAVSHCQDSLLVRALDFWSKGEFESRQEQWENFILQSQLCVLTLIRCPFHTHGVSAVARESPRSFCQKCRWQVTPKHAYTLDPSKSEWADYAAVQAECGNLSGNELTCNSSGSIWSQSSQLGEPLWTDPGLKSGISLRELISTKKKKSADMAFSQSPRMWGKSHQHTTLSHTHWSHSTRSVWNWHTHLWSVVVTHRSLHPTKSSPW